MDETPWEQINISYAGETAQQREEHAIAHLGQVLPTVETAGLITSWWFIRKGAWRIRYLPAQNQDGHNQARKRLTDAVSWTSDIYEPETHAFGGPDAMTAAHTLFHHDSRHLLTYLHQHPADRRERSLILCTALMRAAGLDLNEQGDVWARVVQHRAELLNQPPTPAATTWNSSPATSAAYSSAPPVTPMTGTAFQDTGTTLQHLRETGKLTRGLRTVLALHVIFHWNRIGLAGATQATLAQAAKEAVFGEGRLPASDDRGGKLGRRSAKPGVQDS